MIAKTRITGFLICFISSPAGEILRLRRRRCIVREIRCSRRRWCREKRLRSKIALYLIVNLVRRCDVLRIHLSHYELSEHLNLLHLRERDFVAHLNRLQITYRRLVLELKVLQGGLLGLEVLGLCLR